ncbi:hypothetical protein [Chryseobacterium bernardetii]|uniref:hypothetical protein n=1 Tax=Chryseobacterium bernardetii TaxID=1241978 RepID=UPI00301B575B
MKNLKSIERKELKKIKGGEIIPPKGECTMFCEITGTNVPCKLMSIFCPQP